MTLPPAVTSHRYASTPDTADAYWEGWTDHTEGRPMNPPISEPQAGAYEWGYTDSMTTIEEPS